MKPEELTILRRKYKGTKRKHEIEVLLNDHTKSDKQYRNEMRIKSQARVPLNRKSKNPINLLREKPEPYS